MRPPTNARPLTRSLTRTVTAVLAACVVTLAACGVQPEVAVERSIEIDGPPRPDSAPVFADDPTPGIPEVVPEVGTDTDGHDVPLDWTDCTDFGIPPAEYLDTQRWECAVLAVPMDPLGGQSGLAPVELALTRHVATGERRGSLLMNPGGPGGSGLEVVWGLRSALPSDILRAFDIVSWDPRGVGQSVPAISCGPDPQPDSSSLMADCAAATGELAAFVAAPYSAEDMEAIRIALGESKLNYLGYSYGTELGAIYAARYPDSVGRFVLDGATDPLAGGPDGHFDQGFPYYADDGVPAAIARFEELCNATDRCDLGADSAVTLDGLRARVESLPTPDFDLDPERVSSGLFADMIDSAMSYVGDWELWSTALGDAANGDASALAALSSREAGLGSEVLDDAVTSFELANLVIYCADFAHVITGWDYCDGLPRNEFPLRPVVGVEVGEPILVLGTTFDPSTPGRHASEFARVLGDAVYMMWDGIGHTAFPAPTRCVDGAVSDYLLAGSLPADGLVCSFLDGVTDDTDIADQLFGHEGIESEALLVDAIERRGGTVDATCVGRALNRLGDRVISHVVLGVTSDEAEAAIAAASTSC